MVACGFNPHLPYKLRRGVKVAHNSLEVVVEVRSFSPQQKSFIENFDSVAQLVEHGTFENLELFREI